MNRVIGYILLGLSSVAAGGVGGWLLAKRKYTKIYNLGINEKYNLKSESTNYIPLDKEKLEQKEENKDSEVKNKDPKPEVEQVEMDLEEPDIEGIPFAVKKDLVNTYAEVMSEYDPVPHTDDIYVISAYEVGCYSEYDAISIKYLPNGTVLDEDGAEIANPDLIFGNVLKNNLFDLETNGELYIRNERMRADYEIIYEQG